MEKAATTILVVMTVIAVFLFSFGAPWHANFFDDFNIVKDGTLDLVSPIKAIADTLRGSYNAVNEVNIFFDNIEFWQGKVAKWAYLCGLKNPYEMTRQECYSAFLDLDKYLEKSFGDDTEKRRQFVIECERYAYFIVYESASGNKFFTWTITTRPTTSINAALLNERPSYQLLFKYIRDYEWADVQKCFSSYTEEIGRMGVSFRQIDVEYQGDVVDFYVMTRVESDFGHDMSRVKVVDLIPFSYQEFMSRCETDYPTKYMANGTIKKPEDMIYYYDDNSFF